MNTKKTKIFVIIFAVLIGTPLLFTTLRIRVKPSDSSKKTIGLNFKRDFPLKLDYIHMYSYIKNKVFNTNPFPKKAISVKNNWKFAGNSLSNIILESKGFLNFSKNELELLEKKMIARNSFLRKEGIKFFIAIAPNKLSIYGQLLKIKKTNKPTKLEQLELICKNNNIGFINLGLKFPNHLDKRLYHKTDTHWNDYGAFFGFKEAINYISDYFSNSNFINYTLNDFTISTIDASVGDLNKMLKENYKEEVFLFDYKNKPIFDTLKKQLQVPLNYKTKPVMYESRFSCNTNKLKILVFNDSFFDTLKKFFINNFGESLYIWNSVFDKNLILLEKPDLVFFELVERDIDNLLINDI